MIKFPFSGTLKIQFARKAATFNSAKCAPRLANTDEKHQKRRRLNRLQHMNAEQNPVEISEENHRYINWPGYGVVPKFR